ncbi:Ras-related protein Rab-13 [Halotydeus destructor]|nr:Ras-related protein Rab-13 [Halotydeus destructor]
MTHDMLIHIAVFGECGSGKTSLIRRYTRNDFDDKYAPSLVDFMTKKLLFDGKPLTLGIWEIPPPYEATSGVTNRYQLADRKDGIVFVYDMTDRKSLEKLQRIVEGLKAVP